MKLNTHYRNIAIVLSALALSVTLFLTHALAGLGSSEVIFAKPPAFVEQYASERFASTQADSTKPTEATLTKDFYREALLVRNVILDGLPINDVIALFSHPEKAKRVKIALALADVNFRLSHDEQSGFDEKRTQFWEDAKAHNTDIQNALFEALIASAKEGTSNHIPYTLAWWMQETKPKAVEVLAWAAKHHPYTWIRNFSVYYVVQFGDNEERASSLISDRVNDPVFRVRKQVLDQRIRRFKERIFGKET